MIRRSCNLPRLILTVSKEEKIEKPIKVVIVDDHPLYVGGLRDYLRSDEAISIVADYNNGKTAVEACSDSPPDVILMDVLVPGIDGVEATRCILQKQKKTKILVLTGMDSPQLVVRAINAGATGFLLKHSSPKLIVEAIKTVHSGSTYFCQEAKEALLNDYVSKSDAQKEDDTVGNLTPREQEVLKLLASGLQNKEVASELEVSVRTVETHRERLYRKLETNSVAGLTRIAISSGLIQLDERLVIEESSGGLYRKC